MSWGRYESLDALVRAFENCSIAHAEWNHSAHLSVAAWFVATDPDSALNSIRQGIKAYNLSQGIPMTETGGYHETVTAFWVHMIHHRLAELRDAGSLEERVAAAVESLSDQKLMLNYYSRELAMSREARFGWVEPDLRALPAL